MKRKDEEKIIIEKTRDGEEKRWRGEEVKNRREGRGMKKRKADGKEGKSIIDKSCKRQSDGFIGDTLLYTGQHSP